MNAIANLVQPGAAYVPLRLAGRPLALKALVLVLGVAFLTASSYVQVPMWPVPMTMQTFAVLAVGAFCGWRLALATVVTWLALAMLNVPLLSEGKAGLAVFMGTTGGYLAAFPIMSAFIGWMAERGWTARTVPAFLTLLIAEVICFTMGVGWLSTIVGLDKAIQYGLLPFALGDLVKAVLATAILAAGRRMAPQGR
ncbi:MAG TPA: biotin transporter BioY [Dongiaceae bacterium]|jgi:biotin transport system substrate-specific component|nr:biotin transporter BioY [Dongiaceae bacterium]